MNDDAIRDPGYYLRRLVDHVPSMLAYWDRDLRCRFANRAYETWFGVDPDRLVGTSIRDLLGPNLFELNEPYIRGALNGAEQTFERVLPGPDGVDRHSLATYIPDVVDGAVVGFLVTVTEVTRLKETEARLHGMIDSLESEIRRRRAAEEVLGDAHAGLAATLASIGAAFLAVDREGRVTGMNAAAERLLGWSEREALGLKVRDVFVQADRPAAEAAMNPVDLMIERGLTIDTAHQVVVVARDGTRTPVEVKAALTHAADGAVRGMAVVLRDMTPVLRAEVDANRLVAIVESSQDAIIGKTLDGRITNWNAAARTMFGYSAEEAVGLPIQILIPKDRQDEEMRILADLARGQRVPAFDTVRRAKDGRLIDVSVTISPIRDAAGRIAGASKIARDVSLQRGAEAALRDSEERLRFTLASAQIGDWELDLASRAVRRSLQHDRCFGYDELQAAWSLQTLLQHAHPDDRDAVSSSFHDAVATGRDWRIECRVVWADASIHWISLHGSVRIDARRPARMLGIIADVTQRKLAEEGRLKAEWLEAENRQIHEANRLKSQFLANMSHELRTPLNAIIGFADLLHSRTVDPQSPKHDIFLGHIATSGRHLLQLINDVLDLSKVESGKFEFFPEPVNLPVLIQEVKDILHTAIERKLVAVGVDVEPGLSGLMLDPARLKQVLYNLMSNAIKFSHDQGRVTIRARSEGDDHIRLEVEDEGIGIAPAQLPRLFTEFQQLDAGYTKQHQGTGLGLALTRRMVEAQGGSVGVRSEPGRGSVFHVVLNRVHGNDTGRDPAASTHAEGAGRHLLVIESDRLIQGWISRSLSEAGFRVDTAATGRQAIEHTRRNRFDGLTLDLKLPDQSGLELLASIRSNGPSSASPVLGVTVTGDSGEAASFAIEDILSKPIRADEVVSALARFRLPGRVRSNVLVIDDEPVALDLMCATLKGLGIDAVCELDARRALRDIAQHRPDAIILDLMMPEFDGFAVLDALHRMPLWRSTPVFIWTSMILTDAEYASLARSAQAILSKGGGAPLTMLERLRRWQPGVAEAPHGSAC
jgi:PAS domain S-box-containing protein